MWIAAMALSVAVALGPAQGRDLADAIAKRYGTNAFVVAATALRQAVSSPGDDGAAGLLSRAWDLADVPQPADRSQLRRGLVDLSAVALDERAPERIRLAAIDWLERLAIGTPLDLPASEGRADAASATEAPAQGSLLAYLDAVAHDASASRPPDAGEAADLVDQTALDLLPLLDDDDALVQVASGQALATMAYFRGTPAAWVAEVLRSDLLSKSGPSRLLFEAQLALRDGTTPADQVAALLEGLQVVARSGDALAGAAANALGELTLVSDGSADPVLALARQPSLCWAVQQPTADALVSLYGEGRVDSWLAEGRAFDQRSAAFEHKLRAAEAARAAGQADSTAAQQQALGKLMMDPTAPLPWPLPPAAVSRTLTAAEAAVVADETVGALWHCLENGARRCTGLRGRNGLSLIAYLLPDDRVMMVTAPHICHLATPQRPSLNYRTLWTNTAGFRNAAKRVPSPERAWRMVAVVLGCTPDDSSAWGLQNPLRLGVGPQPRAVGSIDNTSQAKWIPVGKWRPTRVVVYLLQDHNNHWVSAPAAYMGSAVGHLGGCGLAAPMGLVP